MKYRGFEIQTSSFRSYGGLELLLELKVLENATDLAKKPHFSTEKDLFSILLRTYLFTKKEVFRFMDFHYRLDTVAQMKKVLNGPLPQEIWKTVIDKSRKTPWLPDAGSHSCHTIVVDEAGNIASGTHTINSPQWGDYGLMVDGVSLNSAHLVTLNAPPGKRAIDGLKPVLVLKDGKPYLTAGFFSSALHPAALQIISNLLDYGLPPKRALELPRFGVVSFGKKEILLDSRFDKDWVSYFAKQGISFRQPAGYIDTGMGMIVRIQSGVREGAATELIHDSVVLIQ